jgi:hypothetical protein
MNLQSPCIVGAALAAALKIYAAALKIHAVTLKILLLPFKIPSNIHQKYLQTSTSTENALANVRLM